MTSEIKVDTISEQTSAGGVTIDGVLVKDNKVDVNGTAGAIILDADADTTISANTDDQIDFNTAGNATHVFDANGHVTLKQFLDATTAGGRITGASNRGDAARINLYQTAGSSDGGEIRFETANSSNTMTERMRITNEGKPSFGFAGSSGSVFMFVRESGNVEIIHADATNASYAEDVVTFDCNRAATSSYNLLRGTSGGQADSEIICDGAGRFAVDGTVNPNGADYAEYFEWKDGNSSSEDRVGYSVVLNGNKIVKATDSDDASKIIGVISGKAAVVGDSAWNKWQLKHLKDDYGRYIYEDYTQTEWTIVEEGKDDIFHSYQTDLIPDGLEVPDDAIVTSKDEDGNNLQRRKVNPDWDKDTVYVPRSDRKEWDTVGLMGKLKVRKGQPTGTNWIKMRDISETIEEWLVR